jgi:hypothetical protein
MGYRAVRVALLDTQLIPPEGEVRLGHRTTKRAGIRSIMAYGK